VRITKVYTRGGDDGTTGLVGGTRIPKNDIRIRAYGTVDELNSALGLALALLREGPAALPPPKRQRIDAELARLQNLLFTVGCDLAVPLSDRFDGMPVVTESHVLELEASIDAFNSEIPPLEEFVLPTGTAAAAALHLARTVCRRAEREVLDLRDREPVGEAMLPFLNRLSDHLFVLARWLSIASGRTEVSWER